ncbi:translation initiation factor IF-3 [Pedococcus bigeumensis]|uniref:translation initiation factor IF-3 n=1 Tax=Pedococcus bigeumensis TaxID=433644 RepID=UPI001F4F2AB6|nr:translation initiation factor IF-3 [Pedococcus bigeumensis]
MRLVGPNGEQVGIVRVEDALRLAAEADLDLVEVAPMAKPPVAKLMDFGKFKYEAALKAREARKNQVNTVIKEIKLRPKIDPHDYGTKKGHVERFLKGGDKVKVTIMFRGREQSRPELGFRLLQRLAEDVIELGTVESAPKQDGRNMIMVLGPTKKKSEAMAEQRRARTAGPAHSDDAAHADDAGHAQDAPAVDHVQEAPVETAVEPTAVEPTAVEPTAVEPAAVEPAAVEPAAVEPTAVEPTAVEPTAPEAATPEPAKPAAAKPTAAKPTAAKPVAAKPVAAKPTAAKPTAAKPAPAKPTAAKPAAKAEPAS